MAGITPTCFGLIWTTLVLLSFGQVCLKQGIGDEIIPLGKSPFHTVVNIIRRMLKPKVLLGFSFYVVGTFIWLVVLSRTPLSIAFPLFSMSYFLVVILSATILRERIDWKFAITGLVFISMGVSLIGLSSPPKPKGRAGRAMTQSTVVSQDATARRHAEHD